MAIAYEMNGNCLGGWVKIRWATGEGQEADQQLGRAKIVSINKQQE